MSSNAPVFEEDDLLSAMHFLNETAAAEGKPLVLCLALGTNQGSHSGTLPVSLTLARYGNTPGVIPVARPATKEMQHTIIMALYPKLTPRKM